MASYAHLGWPTRKGHHRGLGQRESQSQVDADTSAIVLIKKVTLDPPGSQAALPGRTSPLQLPETPRGPERSGESRADSVHPPQALPGPDA